MRIKLRQLGQFLFIFSFLALLSWHLQTLTNHTDIKRESSRAPCPRQVASALLKQSGESDDYYNSTSLRLYDQYASAPFVDSRPKMVVVMTYQRAGSSFFGEIFDRHPGVFYVYEPLDAIYSAMYGTKEGWNVPSDITAFWNGSERIPPENDVHQVTAFLENLLTCNVDSIPTEFFRHRYWATMSRVFQSGLMDYQKCMRSIRYRQYGCSEILPNITCPMRFGEDLEQMEKCRENLENPPSQGAFKDYVNCNAKQRQQLAKCIPILEKNCVKATLKATKTVRANMASMGRLLARNPNSRVIHLVRDPRAIVLSRMRYYSARGKYSGDSYVKESRIFCRSAVRDLKLRQRLEEKYPGKIIQVIYDDFVRDPLGYTSAIYRFLDEQIAPDTREWLLKNTQGAKNSSVIARKWQYKIPYRHAIQIADYCKEYFHEIPYPWD